MVLKALEEHLMTPELCDVFSKTYLEHINKLRRSHDSERAAREIELKKIDREQDKLIEAIKNGVPPNKIKEEMIRLDKRRNELEAHLANTADEPIRLHPNMSQFYRERIAGLCDRADADISEFAKFDHVSTRLLATQNWAHEVDPSQQ